MSEEEAVAEELQEEPEAAQPEPAEAADPPAEAAAEAQEEQPAPEQEVAAPEPEEAESAPEEERHQLSRPRVIPFDSLLRPISGESPSGEYLRYHGIYDEISETRRADDVVDLGAWQTDLKVADFRKTIELAVPVLETQTKDLQIAAWLVEAIVAEHGFAGLRDGLDLLSSLIRKFWGSIYPSADDGDEEGRANALAWVDRETAMLVKNAAITVDGWGYNGYLDSKKFDIPANLDSLNDEEKKKFSALKEQAERENRATAARWTVAVAKTNRAFCEEVHVAILECEAAYKALNDAIEETFDRNQAPSLPEIRRSLQEIKSVQNELLEAKRLEEPDPADEAAGEGSESGGDARRGASGVSGPISNREDALKRLAEVAAYFKKTEPHSPVSYLVSRAIQWGHMPLENWLQDVIKDQGILEHLKQTLGFNTVAQIPEKPAEPEQAPPPENSQ